MAYRHILWVLVLAMLAVSAAGPNTRRRRDFDDSDAELAPARNLERTGRYPRFTCDLLPSIITIGGPNTACAAYCLTKGKKDGHCDGAVCVCSD
ncbi:Defensin [Frankliniella occidentalis]|nr:Defensin [Frankliniella occidentalis]